MPPETRRWLSQLCRASKGMVVNNSTAALSALGFGAPVKVLGKAFFVYWPAGYRPLSSKAPAVVPGGGSYLSIAPCAGSARQSTR